jgi:hypothetical protein
MAAGGIGRSNQEVIMTVAITTHRENYGEILKKYGAAVPVLASRPQRLLEGEPAYIVDQGPETYRNWALIKEADCGQTTAIPR